MRKWSMILMVLMLLTPMNAWAQPLGFSGGVSDEYEYEEIVFLTGEPIKFVGTITTKENAKADEKSVSYTLKLEPKDPSINASLSRNITLVTKYNKRDDRGQTIGQTSMDKYRETLRYGKDRYELEDYQLSQSDIIDNRAASDFYSGNLKGRKYYTINRDEGKVIVDISGGDVGYNNFWGNTETQILNYTIESTREVEDEDGDTDTVDWHGTVSVQVSDSLNKVLKYSDNEASLSSFYGGHVRVTNQEIVSRYDYNMPEVDEDEEDLVDRINDRKRDEHIYELRKKKVPKIERLILPKFKDIGGHFAEQSIKKLYSLDVFEENSPFFTPEVPITRGEYVKAVMRACNIRPNSVQTSKPTRRSRRGRGTPLEVSPFKDVEVQDTNYAYIKDSVEKGLIKGISDDLFGVDKPLTKAEAVTMIIKALGFDNKEPAPGMITPFTDDQDIPVWAKGSMYLAGQMNIIRGDSTNRIHPNENITKAQAATMLDRFLEFLQRDLQKDYRENIINF